jgi:glucosylceramidase
MKRISRLTKVVVVFIPLFINIQCQQPKESDIIVYTSSADGDRLLKTTSFSSKSDTDSSLTIIKIDTTVIFQKIDGFGASFNEAGMICLNSLSVEAKNSVVKMLFDPECGAGFTLMKSPIGACDFASAGPWYTYNETTGDTAMIHFSIERDLKPDGLVSYIKEAMKYGNFEIESPMDFAPDWMYFSLKPGEKHIKPEYFNSLALYYTRYIQAYAEQGITIDYLNLFNEANHEHYSNVAYKVIGELIKNYVAPRLKAEGISTKLQLGETCDRTEALELFPPVLEDPDVRKHISSFTVHGYNWDNFEVLTETHKRYPEFPIWMTEVCYAPHCCIPPDGPTIVPVYGFSDGEFWGNTIMNDMKNWVSGWIYWNMILDQNGGPWLVSAEHGDPDNNNQHPVVIINRDTKEVTYTGLYYYLAHFSKFIRPGAIRVNAIGTHDQLNLTSFKNADGSIVLNIINNGDEMECNISFMEKKTTQKLKAHSITTVIWKNYKLKSEKELKII